MAGIIARTPTAGELERAAEVAYKAFGDSTLDKWVESFHRTADMFGREYVSVVEMDGQIVSSLLCCPSPIYVGESLVSHSSVGGVGTLPEYRKHGCAAALMTYTVKLLKKHGIATSSLWPFSYNYYRKFGYEVGAEVRTYTAVGKTYVEMNKAEGVRAAKSSDLDAIKNAYELYAPSFNCLTERSTDWWHRIADVPEKLEMVTESGRGAVVHERKGEVDGYAIYDVRSNEHKRWFDVLEVAESQTGDRLAMLAKIASIDPELDISFPAPADDRFMHEFPNPRQLHCSVTPSFQFRVIDPELAMRSLMADDEVSGKFTLSLHDSVFKHGFEFGVESDEGEIKLCKPERRNRLEMDIQTLAKLYSGYITPLDAWTLGQIKADDLEPVLLACTVFPTLQPYRSGLEPG